jgi:two-component sensor histidine kinase
MMQLIEIPSLKRSSSETRLLLREYSHRINNEFASAIGAISVAAAHSATNEAKAVLAADQDQLQNASAPRLAITRTQQLHRRGRISPTTMPGDQPFQA